VIFFTKLKLGQPAVGVWSFFVADALITLCPKSSNLLTLKTFCIHSGVTRVGDIRGRNWGVFPQKNWRTFLLITVSRLPVLRCHPYLFSPKKLTTFLLITITFIDFTRVSPPAGCHLAPFSPLRPRLSTILCKFAHIKFFSVRCHFPGGCHPRRSAPPRPSSDATVYTSGLTWSNCVLNFSQMEQSAADLHRRSQDFVSGCTFFLKMVTTFFCLSPSKDGLRLLNQPLLLPNLPKNVDKFTLTLPMMHTWCAGGALTNFPCKLRL